MTDFAKLDPLAREIQAAMETLKRVLAYVRVSTEEQRGSGAGLAAQRAAILAECKHRGWHLEDRVATAQGGAKWYPLERAIPAVNTSRPLLPQ